MMMDKWIEVKLSDIGKTYSGLSNKSAKDFGYGKDYIPYLNIYNNSKVNINFFEKVNIKKRENQNKVKYGDIFFTTSSETPDEVGMSSVLLDEVNEVYLNSFCFGFRLNDFNTLRPEFARYYFRGMGFRKQMNYLAQGSTRYNLSKVALLKYKAILPTIPEQSKIAEILTTIDDAIEQTEKIIEKYKRIKQGLLQDLLTKGIDENGNIRSEATHEFKDSPLGRIPVEWDIVPINSIGKIITGNTPSTKDLGNFGGNYLFVTPSDISGKEICKTERTLTDKGMKFTRIVPKNSICVVCIGSTIGKIGIIKHECATNQQINTIICSENVDYNYIYYACLAYLKRQLDIEVGLQAVPIVNKNTFSTLLIPLMGKPEQVRISHILNKIDYSIKDEQKYYNKLKAIKQGLMQDLLSGKVRVTHLLDKGGKSDECHP